jgi:hypothetical protein
MAPKHELYVERRDQGDYAVRRPGSERASDVAPTQSKAIERAREIDPKASIHVEPSETRMSVVGTNGGSRSFGEQPATSP